ncbi:MAG: MATE family efflux transporter [Clostridium sp.]|uniref:MATE family efflux transporter n=1 Tax=Clostridium sp. TaxID=1506 RepID=UPI003F3CA457
MKNNDLLKDDIHKLIVKYMVPSVLGMLGLSCCIFLDTMFIGRGIGEQGLAALNIAIPFFSIFTAFSLLTGVGGATLLSISMGKKQYDKANEIFTISIVLTAIFSVLFSFFTLIFINDIVRSLGATGIISVYVKQYLEVILFGGILFIMSTTLNVFIRNDGNPKASMWAIIGSNLTNIILDYLLIFPLGMGMRGAAIATTFAQVVGISILLTHFIFKKNKIKFSFKEIKFKFVKRILGNGTSSFILELSAGLVIILFNLKLKEIGGNISISAYSIIANFSLIIIAIFNGIAQGLQPIISMNYGGEKYDRVIKAYKEGLKITVIVGGAFFLLGEIFPNVIVNIFQSGNEELLKIASLGIKIYFVALIPMGLNILNVGFMQSIEKSRKATLVSFLRGLVLIIIFLEVLSKLFGLNGIWLTTPVVEFIALFLSFYFVLKERRNFKKVI